MRAREERLLNLLSALLTAGRPLGFREIRGRVAGYEEGPSEDAIEKRFDRDKQDLRRLGVPLEFVPEGGRGGGGYRIVRERFFLDEIRFSFEEGIVLAAIERDLSEAEAEEGANALRSALAKIGVDSPLPESFRESVAEQQVLDARMPREEGRGMGCLATVAEALAERRPVRFPYYTLGSGEEAIRVVEPWGLGYFRGNWYLVGFDREKGGERTFRTSRITGEVQVLPASGYEIPEDFDLSERIGRSPWELASGEPVTARIRFEPAIAFMIGENVRPGQTFETEADGGGVLTVTATDPGALVRWVAQYGPLAKVLEPKSVREEMCRHLDGIHGRYAG